MKHVKDPVLVTGVLSINLARISMISSFDIPGEITIIIEAIQARGTFNNIVSLLGGTEFRVEWDKSAPGFERPSWIVKRGVD